MHKAIVLFNYLDLMTPFIYLISRPYSWKLEPNINDLYSDILYGIEEHCSKIKFNFLGAIIAIHDANHKNIEPIDQDCKPKGFLL